jgi:DNA-binding GntR family transcriptional regulator
MQKKLRHNSEPIHVQIEEIIMEDIKNGVLKPGDCVGSEFGIARKYGISRSTVRNVFDRLVAKNILMRRAGKGTFVAFPVATKNTSLLVGFSEKMKEIGYTIKTKVDKVEVKTSSSNVQKVLKIGQSDKIIEINRIRYINDIPFVIHCAYLPFERCKDVMKVDLEKYSLTSTLKNILGIHLSYAEETIYAYASTNEESKLLEIKKGSPILVTEGLTFDDNKIPVRYSIAKYRHDVVRLKTNNNSG